LHISPFSFQPNSTWLDYHPHLPIFSILSFFSGIEPYGIYAWIGMVKRCREMGNVASFKQQLELANGVSNFWLPGIDKLALIKSLVFYHFVYRFSPLHFFLYLGFRHFSPHHMYLLFFCFWNLQHIPLTRNGIGVAGQDGAEDMTRRGRETGIWDGDIDGWTLLFCPHFSLHFVWVLISHFTPFLSVSTYHGIHICSIDSSFGKSVWLQPFKHFVLNFICVCFAFESIFISLHFHQFSSLSPPPFFLTEISSSCRLRFIPYVLDTDPFVFISPSFFCTPVEIWKNTET